MATAPKGGVPMLYEFLTLFLAPIIVGVILLFIERYLNTHDNK